MTKYEVTLILSRLASVFLVTLCLSLTLTSGTRAEPLEEAIEAWLVDNDEVALPALTALAEQGDVRAQLLLGKIATRPFSPYLEALPRKQRLALIRAPGGLSGRSWLKIAAENGDALAAAFLGVSVRPFSSRDIATLLDKGEFDAATMTMRRVASYGEVEGLRDLIARRAFPPDAAYAIRVVAFRSGNATPLESWKPGDDPLRLIEVLAVNAAMGQHPSESPERDVSLRLFGGDYWDTKPEPAGQLLLEAAPHSRAAQRIVNYCHAACPGMLIRSCIGDAVGLISGYDFLWRFGPPVQSLISEERYLESPRFHADFARHLKTLIGAWPQELQDDWSERSCAAASRLRIKFGGAARIGST